MKPSDRLMRKCEKENADALFWLEYMQSEVQNAELQRLLKNQWEMNRDFLNHLSRKVRKESLIQKMEIFIKLHSGLLFRHTDRDVVSLLFDASFERMKRVSQSLNQSKCQEPDCIGMIHEFIELQEHCTRQLRVFL